MSTGCCSTIFLIFFYFFLLHLLRLPCLDVNRLLQDHLPAQERLVRSRDVALIKNKNKIKIKNKKTCLPMLAVRLGVGVLGCFGVRV